MSARIICCLLVGIASATVAALWVVFTGWGLLVALLAYSVAGSSALMLSSLAAVAIETRPRVSIRLALKGSALILHRT